jgi:hypothetical protein
MGIASFPPAVKEYSKKWEVEWLDRMIRDV